MIHLVPTPRRPSSIDRRVAMGGVVAGSAFVVAALVRIATGGQDPRTFLLAVACAVLIVGGVFLYGYLRLWNATVFCDGVRIGVTNALGLPASLRISDVDHLEKVIETDSAGKPVAALLIMSKGKKRVLRFKGADRLQPGGLESIASEVGVQINGSW